ncbi:MAG: MFS transporter [Candidatus Binatia bacterium]
MPAPFVVRLAYFVVFLGAGVWLPYMPLYLASLGFEGWQIGLLGAMAPALRWASAIALGWVADRRRNRHRLLVVTAALGSLGFVPLIFVHDFRTLVLVFVGINLCHGTLIPMVDAIVVDHLAELGSDYGRLRLFGSISFGVGSVVSALLVHASGPGVVPLLLVVPNLFLAPVMYFLPRRQLGHPEHARPPWTLVTPPMAAFLATVFLTQASCGAWAGFFALYVRALGLSNSLPGITFALAVVGEMALFHFGRRVLGWIPPADLILVTLVVTVVRWALSAVVTSEWAVVAVQLGHVFTFSAFHLAAVALVAELVPPANTTSGQSLYGLVGFGFGGTVGIALAGVLVDRLGAPGLFWFEAVVALAGVVPAWWLRRILTHVRAGARA